MMTVQRNASKVEAQISVKFWRSARTEHKQTHHAEGDKNFTIPSNFFIQAGAKQHSIKKQRMGEEATGRENLLDIQALYGRAHILRKEVGWRSIKYPSM